MVVAARPLADQFWLGHFPANHDRAFIHGGTCLLNRRPWSSGISIAAK